MCCSPGQGAAKQYLFPIFTLRSALHGKGPSALGRSPAARKERQLHGSKKPLHFESFSLANRRVSFSPIEKLCVLTSKTLRRKTGTRALPVNELTIKIVRSTMADFGNHFSERSSR